MDIKTLTQRTRLPALCPMGRISNHQGIVGIKIGINAMWTILDLFDDVYFELKLILLAIEMDNLSALLESVPPPCTFDPFQTIR